ncbi:MAG TPA: 3-oxoacyl-[acyl-carrier-protein] reductase [Candidatus Limnocylindria bacterium]
MTRLDGKTALVTGAGRGIGRATAVRLAKEGARIAVNYKGNTAAAEETKRAVEAAGSMAALIQGDVSVDVDAERVVREALAFGDGRLDILVNNAGITRDNLLLRMSAEEWDAVLDLNLRGAFLVTKAAMRPMMKQRGGRIVNVSSIAGVMGNAGQANYSAAKAGLIAFTKTVAREMASRNITANAVAPGFVPTDLTSIVPQAVQDAMLAQIPLARFGTAEDVANAIAFLASDEASYITGQVLIVDGGMVTA